MTFENIRLGTTDGIARLVLNRPEKLNSFTVELHAELALALEQLRKDPPRVLVISGAGRGFCAGQDLSEREMLVQGASVDLGASIERTYNPMIRTLQACEFPTIAQVHGVAAGAGSSFALACDLVYAARSAYFVQAFVRIGLAPDAGGSWQLVHRAGLARAMGMAMLGQRIGAPLAAEWGLIWSCVEDDALESSVTGAAHELATLPAEALRAIKSLLRNASHHSLDEQLNQERDAQRLLGCTPDFREGVTAFLARRTPRYGGKLHQ